jgi:6-phosphogluconolactonase
VNITSFRVVDDPAQQGAAEIAGAMTGRRTLAVSRGGAIFRHLAAAIAWDGVDVFQVDERAAPDGSDERNLTALRRELGAERVHPMPVGSDLDWGAAAYAKTLEETCGSPPVLDVVHLGIGPDGHTASLVPGDPVLEVRDRPVAVTGVYQDYRRMTLTYPALDAARVVVIIAAGTAKARAVAAVVGGQTWAPAARLQSADVRLVVDADAAAETK